MEVPTIEILPPESFSRLDQALRRNQEFNWLILTSVNGVEALAARCRKVRIPIARLERLKIAAIGPATRRALEELGLSAEVVPSEYVAEAVIEKLRHKVKGKRVLLVRAAVARDVIPKELQRAGAAVEVVEAYRTLAPAGSRRKLQAMFRDPDRRPDVITFTSSSTARNFRELMRGVSKDSLWDTIMASIGPVTSSTLRGCGYRVDIEAREYTMAGLAGAITKAARSRRGKDSR